MHRMHRLQRLNYNVHLQPCRMQDLGNSRQIWSKVRQAHEDWKSLGRLCCWTSASHHLGDWLLWPCDRSWRLFNGLSTSKLLWLQPSTVLAESSRRHSTTSQKFEDGLQGQPFHVRELPELALGLRGLGWPCKWGTKTASCCPVVSLQTFAEPHMLYKLLLIFPDIYIYLYVCIYICICICIF